MRFSHATEIRKLVCSVVRIAGRSQDRPAFLQRSQGFKNMVSETTSKRRIEMSKHTPGPWRVDGFLDGTNFPGIMHEVFDDNKKCIRAAQIMPFYDCDPNGKDYARHMADKRLIEAAPDLLAALNEAEKYIGALPKPSVKKDFSGLNHLEQTLKAVRLAIAKATGESATNPALEALRYHVSGAIERGEGVAITEQRVDAKITELIRDVKDSDCALSAIFDDGSTRKLFNFFIDELAFFDADLIGKTEAEAHQLHSARIIAYIQS